MGGLHFNDKRKTKMFLFFSFFIIFLFFLSIYREKQKIDRHYLIEKDTEISFDAEQVWVNHGAVFINDSIVIATGNRIISEVPLWIKTSERAKRANRFNEYTLADIEPPYRIYKKGNSFNFFVIKFNDTVKIQFPNPDYKDPNDPTFEDLFNRIFKGD